MLLCAPGFAKDIAAESTSSPGLSSPGLKEIRQVEDAATRSSLLLALIEACAEEPCESTLSGLITEFETSLKRVSDRARQATLLLRLAETERRLGSEQKALSSLRRALQQARAAATPLPQEVMLRLALAFKQAGQDAEAA